MKLNLVKDEMSMIIENISEQFEMINQHETEIPQIEIDIFMRNIQKLYENTIFLNKINQSKESLASTENHKKEEQTDLETENKIVEDNKPSEEIYDEKEKPSTEIIAIEEDNIPGKSINIQNQESTFKASKPVIEEKEENINPLTIENIPENLKEEKPEKEEIKSRAPKMIEPTLSFDDILEDEKEEDLFSSVKANSEIVDLNNKLAEARNTQSIVEKLQTKRIESLKTVIGINDKFFFINELFSGDSQKYEDIIYTLNNFKKLEDALVYFSTLKYKFSWDEDSEAYIRLSQMLERKFELVNA